MITKLVRFESTDDLQLHGALFTPERKTHKIVIHVHGSGGSFYSDRYLDSFASEFTSKGWALLTFNNRGACYMQKFYREDDFFMIGNSTEVFDECTDDIDGAIQFARLQGYKDIVLHGHSLGCNKVVHYARKTGFNGKLALLAPVDMVELSILGHVTRKLPWKADTSIDIFRYRDKKIVASLSKLENKILVQIGSKDEYIKHDKQHCFHYIKSLFPKAVVEFCLLEKADHRFGGQDGECAAQNITEWLESK